MGASFIPLAATHGPRVFRPDHNPAPPVSANAEPDHVAMAAARAEALFEERRAQGYAAGLAAGQRGAEASGHERVAIALEILTATLDDARRELDVAARDAAAALAALTCGLIEALAPGLVGRSTPDLLGRLAETLRPRLGLLRNPSIAVAPGTVGLLASALLGTDVALTEDDSLAPGDARVSWVGGELRMCRVSRLAALHEAIMQAGLALEE